MNVKSSVFSGHLKCLLITILLLHNLVVYTTHIDENKKKSNVSGLLYTKDNEVDKRQC